MCVCVCVCVCVCIYIYIYIYIPPAATAGGIGLGKYASAIVRYILPIFFLSPVWVEKPHSSLRLAVSGSERLPARGMYRVDSIACWKSLIVYVCVVWKWVKKGIPRVSKQAV